MKCPRCDREPSPAGVVVVDGEELTAYQCDRCTRQTTICGVPCEVAVTFAVSRDGRIVEVGTPRPDEN